MIVLVGFMGAGKTTVGRLLAVMTGRPFADTDEHIEWSAGKEITEIFETGGEAAFRAFERDAVAFALAGGESIVSVGGGALGDPRTRTLLEWHDVVHLDVSFPEAMRRIGGTARPMLGVRDPKELYDERHRLYERSSQLTVATDGRRPEEIAAEIARAFDLASGVGVARVAVKVARPYEVVVGDGVARRIEDFLPELPGAEKAVIITHPSLRPIAEPVAASLVGRALDVHTIDVPEGESAKSLQQAEALYRTLAELAVHRRDVVVGVGGGVVTDLAAFVASTYNRGLPILHVATSLLAQVDAAVGGKTGVNLPAGKNLVGTIHQPILVVCDVATLDSLPDDEFTSGLAEVVKYGFIEQPDLLASLSDNVEALRSRDHDLLRDIVARSVAIKAAIVSVDERETGVREVLNYGHTFGHAFEQASGYSLRHGHAVSLGMMAAAYLAQEMHRIEPEVVDLHRVVLEALGLPVRGTFDIDQLEQAWVRDKKYREGVRFVLLAALGKAEAGVRASRPALARAMERLAG